jgi:mannan endo-1,4-beta-mannosidase
MFVRTQENRFELDGRPFLVNGANNYYATFRSEKMVQAVFRVCRDARFNVLRTWGFYDTDGPDPWVWLQSAPGVYNDGPNGLQLADRAVALARENGIKLIMPLVNYWPDFGGMDRYCKWLGLEQREQFYTDPRARQAYKDWARHVVLHYRDDETIMAWELANEPRCEAAGGDGTLLDWAAEMSAFIKSIDGNHLVALGDEGFFKRTWAGSNHAYNGQHGVDCEALMGIGTLDFGVCHLYPTYDASVSPAEFGSRWIREHIEAAQRAGKLMLIEEYGLITKDLAERDRIYGQWWNTIEECNGAGACLWMIASDADEPGQRYPDYDGYTTYEPTEIPSVVGRV